MISQSEITLPPFRRGFHLITGYILDRIRPLPQSGLLHVFIKHTSAGITLNENADPTVLLDFETVFNRLVPDVAGSYVHNDEGADDMPAHIKASLTGSSVTIPVSNNLLNLGPWQGIYLGEFRNRASGRSLVITVYS
jgi:secondary thiamine-phosphate synthase enzyme